MKNQFSKLSHDKKKCDNIQQIKNINRGILNNNDNNRLNNRLKSKFSVNEGVDNIVQRIKKEDDELKNVESNVLESNNSKEVSFNDLNNKN